MARKSVLPGLTAAVVLSLAPVATSAAASDPHANPATRVPPDVAMADPCATPPQPPMNVRASGGFSPTTIIVSWTIVPPPDACTLAGLDILRAQGATGGVFTKVAQTPVTTAFTDAQLQPSTSYRYQVRSRTTNGLISIPSTTAQATTADACFPQLLFPPALSVLAVTSTSVSLSWSRANSRCVVFDIQRATGATSTTFTVVGTASDSTFTDTTVSLDTTYRYRVRARIVTTGGTWGHTNTVNVPTPNGAAPG